MKNLTSFSVLFQNKIFRIPDYQRGYAWQEEQLRDFWEDILNLPQDHSHYTGMISLKELSLKEIENWDEDDKWIIESKKYRAFHVVDGQQRLTTFVILLKSIINLAKKNGFEYLLEDGIDSLIAKYLFEENKNHVLKAYKFGYEKDNPSFEYLKYQILENNPQKSLDKTFYTQNLSKAQAFFDQRLKELFALGFGKVEDVFQKLTNGLQFNIYEIESDFDVNVAFETMNNRGKKLSNLEILKNRLIYLTTIYDDSILAENEKSKIRKEINDAWKEIYKQLGRKEKDPLNDDEFLKNHWIMYFKYSRRKGDDYIKFLLKDHFTVRAVQGKEREIQLYEDSLEEGEIGSQSEIFKDDSVLHYREIENYAANLSELSQYWFYSYHPEYAFEAGFSENEVMWLNRLNRVGIANFRPLVVASLRNHDVSSEERIQLFTTIEKCIFVWFRMGAFNNSLNSVDAYNYSRTLLEKNNIQEILSFFEQKFKESYQGAKRAFITRITNNFGKDGFFDWQDLRYFLYEYEEHLHFKSKHTEVAPAEWRPAAKGFYSIEHIYPQTATDWYWENEFRDYNEDEKEICVKTIGNMLLLSKDINSALQNYSFPRKCRPINGERTGYANGSFSEREVCDSFSSWNPQTIYDRGKKLLHFFKTRWDIDFTSNEKDTLLGMDFMKNERHITEERFNPTLLQERIINAFDASHFIVNVKKTYIQIMRPHWVFKNNISGSIHFEIFTQNRVGFDDLLGKERPVQIAFHTEDGCPEELRKQFKALRKEVGESQLAKNFSTPDKYLESVINVIDGIRKCFETFEPKVTKELEAFAKQNMPK